MIKLLRNMMLVLLLILVCSPVFAQQDKLPLPRVLIIGDSVYTQFTRGAISELKDQAQVQFANWPRFVLPSSTNAIEHLDLLLGLKDASGKEVPEDKRPTWDLIHLNVGIGDLIHCVPDIKSHRTLPYDFGGVVRTDTQQYEKNLDTLARLLKQKAPRSSGPAQRRYGSQKSNCSSRAVRLSTTRSPSG